MKNGQQHKLRRRHKKWTVDRKKKKKETKRCSANERIEEVPTDEFKQAEGGTQKKEEKKITSRRN